LELAHDLDQPRINSALVVSVRVTQLAQVTPHALDLLCLVPHDPRTHTERAASARDDL